RVHHHQSGDALGHCLGGQDHHLLAFGKGHTLLGGHDDVAVVGQHEDDFRRSGINLLHNIVGGGVHGLTAANDTVSAQIPEYSGQAVAGGYRHHTILLFGSGDL